MSFCDMTHSHIPGKGYTSSHRQSNEKSKQEANKSSSTLYFMTYGSSSYVRHLLMYVCLTKDICRDTNAILVHLPDDMVIQVKPVGKGTWMTKQKGKQNKRSLRGEGRGKKLTLSFIFIAWTQVIHPNYCVINHVSKCTVTAQSLVKINVYRRKQQSWRM